MIKIIEVIVKSFFFIDREKFLRDMVELSLKEKGLAIYTIDSAKDCIYLIKDLTPDLIIVDLDTLLPNLEDFFSGLDQDNIKPHILSIGTQDGWSKLGSYQSRFIAFEEKPLIASGMSDRFLKLC